MFNNRVLLELLFNEFLYINSLNFNKEELQQMMQLQSLSTNHLIIKISSRLPRSNNLFIVSPVQFLQSIVQNVLSNHQILLQRSLLAQRIKLFLLRQIDLNFNLIPLTKLRLNMLNTSQTFQISLNHDTHSSR